MFINMVRPSLGRKILSLEFVPLLIVRASLLEQPDSVRSCGSCPPLQPMVYWQTHHPTCREHLLWVATDTGTMRGSGGKDDVLLLLGIEEVRCTRSPGLQRTLFAGGH